MAKHVPFRRRLSADTVATVATSLRLEADRSNVAGVTPCAGNPAEAAHPIDRATYQERAAIVEHDAGIPRAYAEAFAHLQRECPAGVPVARWRQFVNDGGKFLDRWGQQAQALGWDAPELFGLDPVSPMARYDRQGLLWLLKGQSIVALTAEAARLSGGLAYYKKDGSGEGERA